MGAFKQDNLTFWIAEDVSGECLSSRLIQVTVSDSIANMVATNNLQYGEWRWFEEGFKSLGVQLYTELGESDGKWTEGRFSFEISVPAPDSQLVRDVNETLRLGQESDWTRKHGLQGVIAPEVKGFKTKIAYYYPNGLYVDYKISRVYLIPTFGYIIIFTQQPRLKSGLDTMHGFLILKIL